MHIIDPTVQCKNGTSHKPKPQAAWQATGRREDPSQSLMTRTTPDHLLTPDNLDFLSTINLHTSAHTKFPLPFSLHPTSFVPIYSFTSYRVSLSDGIMACKFFWFLPNRLFVACRLPRRIGDQSPIHIHPIYLVVASSHLWMGASSSRFTSNCLHTIQGPNFPLSDLASSP